MVFGKVLFATVLGLSSAAEVITDANATANATSNETDFEEMQALTEEDIKEFLSSADTDKDGKVNETEVNKLFQFDMSDEELKKMFEGVEEDDIKFLLEQKANVSTMFAEADADKDGALTHAELWGSDSFKSFLQQASNDGYGDEMDGEYGDDMEGEYGDEMGEDGEGGEFMEGDMGEDDEYGQDDMGELGDDEEGGDDMSHRGPSGGSKGRGGKTRSA